jgi:hypothetical protein
MNSNFIDFTLENIFSEVIPMANTFFNEYNIQVAQSYQDIIYAEIEVACKYALELSWMFGMIQNIYYDELNDKNSYDFFQDLAKEAKHYISIDYPKQAVFLSMMNKAEEWYKHNYPHQAAIIIIEESGLSSILLD